MPAMCEERERLLDYLYDVCDADERRRVDAHLEACEGCREEIGGLRAVRQDLLAWDVPEHGSVWKPFVPVRQAPWWREVPVWALAAAASVMFLIGLVGGLVSRALAPAAVSAAAVVQQQVAAPAVSRAELAAMEQRLLSVVQTQIEQRMAPMPAHVLTPVAMVNRDDVLKQVNVMLTASEQRQQQALESNLRMLLQDSDRTFVRNAKFVTLSNELQRMRWDVAQALQQQGGKQ